MSPGGWFNIKMPSYQYRITHCGDKTILQPSYLHNVISYTGKMSSLYWIRTQLFDDLEDLGLCWNGGNWHNNLNPLPQGTTWKRGIKILDWERIVRSLPHCTNDFPIIFQIWWKFHSALILILNTVLGRSWAFVTSAKIYDDQVFSNGMIANGIC